MSKPFYITTAISYPNGRPHIGHAYEAIATDAIARFQRLRGRDVFFLTGTDEHGLKMAQAARERGIEPAIFAEEMSATFKQMDDDLNISYDRFIRTTEPEHHKASRAIWQAMADRGDLYLGRYEGWYSVRDEAYYGEEELVAADSGEKLSPQGTEVEWTVEESWFFRLSAYQDRLLAHYEADPGFIRPDSRRNEVMRFVEGGLNDLSISRASFDWGVKVPGSENHVMYVWLDALTNYLTGVGYPQDTEAYRRYWPADLHIIGKDVVRFHAVYWPAFLMSADIPLPKQVFGHGWLLSRGEKMSKSGGNVVDPHALVDAFGVDQLRYFLLREVSFGQDGGYTIEAIVTRTNADLANNIGNLAQRTLSMIARNCGGRVPDPGAGSGDPEMAPLFEDHVGLYFGSMEKLELHRAIEHALFLSGYLNNYVAANQPWALKASNPKQMEKVLYWAAEGLRRVAILLLPFIPDSAGRLLDQLGAGSDERDFAALDRPLAPGRALPAPSGVFPRLEVPSAG